MRGLIRFGKKMVRLINASATLFSNGAKSVGLKLISNRRTQAERLHVTTTLVRVACPSFPLHNDDKAKRSLKLVVKLLLVAV